MAASRDIVIIGAGIGGLTAALALAQRGFRITIVEQAERLEETGAGIQLSPNATRVLLALGLEERLMHDVVVPDAVEIAAADGRVLAKVPLGANAEARYGAPYWVVHRGDLQAALVNAVRVHPDITLKLGTRFEDHVVHANGVSVACRRGTVAADERGIALIGADGLWSALRARLGHAALPVFRQRVAWRALLPSDRVDAIFREPVVRLWLGHDAHLVHYPVRAGALINIVGIVGDDSDTPGWSEPAPREALLARYRPQAWHTRALRLVAEPAHWLRWSLHDLAPLSRWGEGPVTLLGDAAHASLPFLAQGAAMAIEDAAVLAASLTREPDDPAAAMRRYEAARRPRVTAAQRAARRNGRVYHLGGTAAALRNFYLRAAPSKLLLRQQDWLYNWRPLPPQP